MRRDISMLGLLFMSMSAIIGSGWLFASSYANTLAGPSSLLAWCVGGGLVIIIAFVFAEICTMIPIVGASCRIPHYTHGTLTSYVFAWVIWLSYLFYAPTEVQATIQYLSVHFPSLTVSDSGALSTYGYITATIILFLFSVINVYSVKWLVRANTILTFIKIIIPVFISIVILFYFFSSVTEIVHPEGHKFAAHGIHGIMMAVSVGGIIFAFNGFKLAAEMAGECKNPKVALPVAIIGSVAICLLIYLLLQTSFLAAIATGTNLGDSHLGPFASLAKAKNLNLIIPFIYAGAIIAPIAAGLMYFSSASKSLYGMSKNGYLPGFIGKLNTHNNPIYAILVSFFMGMLIFLFFKGWDIMAATITVLFALTYVIGPINLITMRKRLPDLPRPFKLPIGYVWSVAAFYSCTLMIYWCGWHIVIIADIVIAIGLSVLFIYMAVSRNKSQIKLNFKQSIWMWIYLIGMSVISHDSTFGGNKLLSNNTAMIILFILCLVCTYLAVKFSLPETIMRERIRKALLNSNDLN